MNKAFVIVFQMIFTVVSAGFLTVGLFLAGIPGWFQGEAGCPQSDLGLGAPFGISTDCSSVGAGSGLIDEIGIAGQLFGAFMALIAAGLVLAGIISMISTMRHGVPEGGALRYVPGRLRERNLLQRRDPRNSVDERPRG